MVNPVLSDTFDSKLVLRIETGGEEVSGFGGPID
jgi:hypothetical protein